MQPVHDGRLQDGVWRPIRASRALALLSGLALVAGCASPTDPRLPAATGTPTSMSMSPCEYGPTLTTRCAMVAAWGDLYRTERDVTLDSTWSGNLPDIVRPIAPGVLQSGTPGEAEIAVQYRGRTTTVRFRVLPVGPPWRVYSGEYHIPVVDASNAALEGVTVAVTAGANVGKQAVSQRNGTAIFVGDFVCGPITVRGTKTGYQDWLGSAVVCGRGGNGSWGSEAVGPVRMIPLS